MELKPGDVVILKSGGHPVTVAEVHDQVVCLWMGGEGDLFRETLPKAVLECRTKFDDPEDERTKTRTKTTTRMRKTITRKAR